MASSRSVYHSSAHTVGRGQTVPFTSRPTGAGEKVVGEVVGDVTDVDDYYYYYMSVGLLTLPNSTPGRRLRCQGGPPLTGAARDARARVRPPLHDSTTQTRVCSVRHNTTAHKPNQITEVGRTPAGAGRAGRRPRSRDGLRCAVCMGSILSVSEREDRKVTTQEERDAGATSSGSFRRPGAEEELFARSRLEAPSAFGHGGGSSITDFRRAS